MRRVKGRARRRVRAYWRRPEAGPVVAATLLAVFLAVFTWSCQSMGPTVVASPLHLVGEPEVRVRVGHHLESVRLTGPRLVFLTEPGSGGILLRTPVVAVADGAGVLMTDAGGSERRYAGAVEVSSGAPRVAGVEPTVTVEGTEYPGRLRIAAAAPEAADAARPGPAASGSAGLDVIASMGMETYLPGVVAKELPGGWPEQTNRVQAVCARTYALHQRERARASGQAYDVESTTRDQAYLGSTARPEAVAAVRGTRGQVLIYAGPDGTTLLRAYYSSTCGGRTSSAIDVWPSGAGYTFNRAGPLQAKPRDWACQKSPVYRWTVDRDRAELEARLRVWGQNAGSGLSRLGTLASISVTRVGATGRPSRYNVADTSGRRVEVNAEELRVACNTPATGIPSPDRKFLVRSGDLEARVDGGVVTISGRGFGHGVGMCQYCAKGLAERGMDYQRQLALFYPGASLDKAY